MCKKSMWWVFLFVFGLTIGGIQSLGWWTRQASAQTPIIQSSCDPYSTPSAVRHQNCQNHHWRALVMQQ